MIGQKVSHYKILDELGSGGMGVVYKAHDTKLNRTVALKFILPKIIKKRENVKKFIREAQAAASLSHPNICTVYEIGEQDENTFMAMEYIEGPSLRELAKKGPLELDKALDFAVQITEGLQEAHERGIIHRDIKSSNIIVNRKNQVKIMDFGLAKIKGDPELSETKAIKGTVSYMSPEQATGGDIDHRTDIWSLGVVLYEMFSGILPFESTQEQLVLYSILNQSPVPLREQKKDIPIELERIVKKCLKKNPNQRYQDIGQLKEDLMSLKQKIKGGTISYKKGTVIRSQSQRVKTFIALSVLVMAAVVLVGGYFVFDWFESPVKLKKSIAVMPFEGVVPERDDESLCFTLTKGVIDRLQESCPELRVVPFPSVERYKGPIGNIDKIGHDLKVQHILYSKVLQEAEKVRIFSDLISVKELRTVKNYIHESELEDYSVIEDQISKSVVNELGLYFMERGLIKSRKRESEKIEAALLYQEGMKALEQKSQFKSFNEWFSEAMNKFDQALDIDPNFALAYWGKGAVYEASYVENNQKEDLMQMMNFFKKAHDLSPDLAEANISMGWANFYQGDLNKAYKSFKKALEISPHNSLVITDVGSFLYSIGLYRPAIKLLSRAIRIEPSYLRAYFLKSSCHWYLGEFEEGLKTIEKRYAIEKENFYIHLLYARFLIMLDQFTQAEKELNEVLKMNPNFDKSSLDLYRALLWTKKEQKDRALELIKNIDDQHLLTITCVYSLLGKKDEAIDNILFGIENGFKMEQAYLYSFPILSNNPCYDNLRDDPRFIEILEQQKKEYNKNMKKYGDLGKKLSFSPRN
ncbi:MAG TPA: protein kinase [Acidobacteriota bacterium]|nr:protein kinase [Acidobacteriota bacterium]